ncbi:MAG TPA: hydroxymethylbilane synthase [Candidatus Dormibacteraeota bacterium]|nr:hydroxymethylbilane synthase [Candidatus Dormibacteraeota bacterium]
MRLRLGTRGSRLARLQSERVALRLRALGHRVEVVTVLTEGDRRPNPSATVPGGSLPEGMFVSALERALIDGRVDLAVHSAKDVPLRPREDLVLAAIPERADPRDALVTAGGGACLQSLAPGATFGTDSPRRMGFVRSWRPDLRHRPLRGNVDGRLRRLGAGEVDVLVVAAAGLDRLGLGGRIDERLDPEVVPPAPAQGALAVQCRASDRRVLEAVARLDDPALRLAVVTERLVLEATGGTCHAPVGALAGVSHGRLWLVAGAAAPDGGERHVVRLEAEPREAEARELAAVAGGELMEKVVSHVA